MKYLLNFNLQHEKGQGEKKNKKKTCLTSCNLRVILVMLLNKPDG